jgi:two-component system cell cycle response regulator
MHVLRTRVKSLVKKKALLDRLCDKYEMAVQSAITDKLTGLYNRRYFDHFLDFEIKRSTRQNASLALLMLDIDNFKQINDSLGHLIGDRILNKLGDIIKSIIRETDLAARYGGEEFSIVMSNTGLEEAAEIAERMRKAISACDFDIKKLPTTVSIGIALYPLDSTSLQDLLSNADRALYRAKHEGKNRVCVYSN